MINEKLQRVIDKVADILGMDLILAFPIKGRRKSSCAIFERKLDNQATTLRLRIDFTNLKIEFFRFGFNHVASSNLYNEFLEWDFATYVYMDKEYKLDVN